MADRREDIRARLMATFRVEADEHLQVLNANLSALERGLPPEEAREVVEATFREMHTLKGAARSVSFKDVENLCQGCEVLLSRVSKQNATLTRAMRSRLQEAVDAVAHLLGGNGHPVPVSDVIESLHRAAGEMEEQPAAAESSSAPDRSTDAPEGPDPSESPTSVRGRPLRSLDSVRIATVRLDDLLLKMEDLLTPKLAAEERAREAKALIDALGRCRPARRPNGNEHGGDALLGRMEAREADPDLLFRAAEQQARRLLAHLLGDIRTISGIVNGLLEDAREMRIMPASVILDFFPRMVRDLARESGKEVEWVCHGGELEVDRKVLEAIKDPLMHLIRNAIDHGIEAPDERERAGKARAGRITVTVAAREQGRIQVCLEDDGRGVDAARVKESAVRARLVPAEAAEGLADRQILDLLYASGLSTSPIVTDVSGHGLGLAIVREQVERLEGQTSVESRPGLGTRVEMTLPATIATFHGLLVRVNGQPFLFPSESVERALRVAPQAVQSVEGREAIQWDSQAVILARLSQVLGLPGVEHRADATSPRACLLVKSGPTRGAFTVDEIEGDREVLIKELNPPLVRVRHVAAAGLLGTGEVVLVLHPGDLLKSLRQAPRARPPSDPPRGPGRRRIILVVDDSITTRTMEKNLLEAEGYDVKVAVNGREALTILRSEPVDLVLSDVDMPRMDGFELTAKIRADRKLADLPVVLVTALESREDKERGIEVGANAYLVKSSFDQTKLMEMIETFL